MGRKSKKEGRYPHTHTHTHTHTRLIHFAAQQKLTHCKATILQSKLIKKTILHSLYSQYYTISDTWHVVFPHVKQIFVSTWVPYTLIPTLCSRRKHQKHISSLGASDHKVKVLVAQSALCDPMDCSLPGSSVHGIFQAILGGDFPNPGIEPESPALQAVLKGSDHKLQIKCYHNPFLRLIH